MARIRSDLTGVVIVTDTANLTPTILRAGDEVPDGVEVGTHVLEPEAAEPDRQPEDNPDPATDPVDLDSLTVEQLREHAALLGVDLAGARKRDDILEILRR